MLLKKCAVHTSDGTSLLALEASVLAVPSRFLTKVRRQPLIIRGAAPSQNLFARSTAFKKKTMS